MKTRTFKRVLTTVAVFVAMLLLASLVLVGCGNKKEEPKNFSDIFDVAVEKYQSTPAESQRANATLQDLETAALYQKVVFTVKEGQSVNMKSFTFNADAGNAVANGQKISYGIAVQNSSHEPVASYYDFYDFAKGGVQSFKYEWNILDTAIINQFLPEGSIITLTFGVKSEAAGQTTLSAYQTPIKLTNFAIA